MGSETGTGSQDDRDSDDEEVGGGNQLLGFMFGNVDNSGELDVDYLDEDAKEHLDALADQLEQSFTDIDFSAKSSETRVAAGGNNGDEDYNAKAEDAVDYEDIDEQYEGPEIQSATEEDHLLPKRNFLSTSGLLTAQEYKSSVFDDENYDDDEENEDEKENAVSITEVQTASRLELASYQESKEEPLSVQVNGKLEATISPDIAAAVPEYDKLLKEGECPANIENLGSTDIQDEVDDMVDSDEFQQEPELQEEKSDVESINTLPVLCMENGMPVLRFSEIFGVYQPVTKIEKREHGYSIHTDKYMQSDILHLVEEDEEAFLRDPCQGYSIMSQDVLDDAPSASDNNEEISNSGSMQSRETKLTQSIKDSCLSAQPMKENLDADLSSNWQSEMSSNFYPLDQLDWEEKIIWGNTPMVCHNFAESGELSGPDSDSVTDGAKYTEGGPVGPHFGLKVSENDNGQSCFVSSPLVSVDRLSGRDSGRLINVSCQESTHQSPMLDSPRERDSTELSNTRKENLLERNQQFSFLTRFKGLGIKNKDLDKGSWLDKIVWDAEKPMSRSKLIFDLQDDRMLFEISDESDYQHLQLHAGAMILARPAKCTAGEYAELPGLEVLSGGRFNVANDKFYSTRKASPQLKSILKKRTAHGVKVWHSIPALKLQTMKPKLTNKEIANFHRPKAVWYPHDNEIACSQLKKQSTQGPFKIILKSLGGKGSKVYVDAEETVSSLKLKAGKKLDFRPSEAVKIIYSGKELEDPKTLAEQNVQPNSLLHLVRTKVYPLVMAQRLPGENKSLRPPGAFKKKSDLSVKDGHVYLMEYCEERPLLLGNAGMGARLCTYYQKLSTDDQTGDKLRNTNSSLGTVLTLDPADKSPFLADIKPGSCQSSLETNMYRAPIFTHKVASTDYLLVRSAKGRLSIRRIDRMHTVGQQEPHMEVMSPVAKGLQTYIMNRLLVYIYREFRDAEKRSQTPCIRADVLSAQFPNISEQFLRKRLKHCADLQKRSNGKWLWVMRRNFHIPSEEELRRMVTPENVCTYESMQSGLNRLKRLGITRLAHLTGLGQLAALSSAMNLLPDEAITLAAASHIERELQITPWNLSSNFVACTSQDRENIERLEITGVGDPSGRGLGFSYVRLAPKAPISNATIKKKPVVAKGSTVTGTDADLRRLSMEAAREVLLKFNVPEEQIAKLTRWHRIAMIRKLSSEQASSGIDIDPMTISKFARGQRMSFLQLQQQTRDKCQEIWDRQAESLAAVDGDEIESDSEANSDLDSFAGDLENLLDAEEFEDLEEVDLEFKHEKLKMRGHPSEARLEEEIEDEATEAAELCRLLMDGAEADGKKNNNKAKPVPGKLDSQPKSSLQSTDANKKKNTQAKIKSGSIKADGSFAAKRDDVCDLNEIETSAKITSSVKPKEAKNSEVRVKIKTYGEKVFKERKSARERFVCGACGQLGHMRTNKNCPKYREDPDAAQVNPTGQDKPSEKPISVDPPSHLEPKPITKKLIAKTAPKPAPAESSDAEKSNVKPKSLKFKCASADKVPEVTPGPAPSSEQPSTSEAETGSRPVPKVSRIIITNKMKADESLHELPKPSIVIKPPADTAKEQPRKKVVFKRPKEFTNVDQGGSYDTGVDSDFRKTKKMVDLTGGLETTRRQDGNPVVGEGMRGKAKDGKRRREEEERRRTAEWNRVETARRVYMEEMRMREEQERLDELRRYEESIRREREEEERQKAQKKKKKKKKELEPQDEYLENYGLGRNNRFKPERDRSAKRKTVIELGRYAAEYDPPPKRRRGGEVGLANILENIVESLRSRHEVSFLFLKPVSKKEAPDYHDIIERPMDLSTIRDKVRRLEYKHRKEFRHDVWQITYNAHVYNEGRNPGIPPLADQLLELCDYLLDQNDMTLTEAEEGIED